ncbi:MAG: hypothetical protein JNK94_02475 [Hyphomonadaceae bacterium]|nr:hypothetical protein [Hyphomonadaceae bacterium]
MRALLLPLMVAALAACGEARTPSGEAEAAEAPRPIGQYRAVSETARVVTGDVAIERGGLIFSRGTVLYTRTLAPRRGYDPVAHGGTSYAALALGPPDVFVELRRVVEESGAGPRLCGDERAGYVALVHEGRPSAVTLLVFAGDEPPGPMARQSRVCGSYGYSAPHGVRTRDGIVMR